MRANFRETRRLRFDPDRDCAREAAAHNKTPMKNKSLRKDQLRGNKSGSKSADAEGKNGWRAANMGHQQ